jgi:hypothetical protein
MPKKALQDTTREQYFSEMVNDRQTTAGDGNADAYLIAVENEKLYHNYIDETDNPFISNISIPWPYIIVESYLGKCIQMLAAMMPYVHVVEEEDDFREAARRVERDVNNVLYRQKWPIFSYLAYKQAFKYPCAFIHEKPWGIYEGKEMPILELMNFFNTYVNPTVLSLEDKDAYLIYETYQPKKVFEDFKGNSRYKNLTKIDVHEGDIYTEEEKEIQTFKEKQSYVQDKYSELVRTRFYWSHDDFGIVTGDDNVIRDDRYNFIGRIPVKVIKPIPLDNEFYGMSILEEGKDLFAECNENRNQFNDAANLMLNPQYIVDRNRSGIKTRTAVARAGNFIFTEDVNALLPQKQDWNLLAMCLRRQDSIYMDIMNYSNAYPQFRGAAQKGQETATEFLGMKSAGELRSDTYNLLLAMMGVEDLIKDIIEFKRMFMTDPSKFYYWPDQKTVKATPEDYEGQFTFKAFAGFKNMQMLERKELIEAMSLIFGGAAGAFLPYVTPKAEEWLDRLLDSFPQIRSPEQLRLTEQERMTAQVEAKFGQVMQMLGGMGGGGEGTKMLPNLGEKAMRIPENEPNAPTGSMFGSENA